MKKIINKTINNWSITIALCFFIVSIVYLLIIGDDLYLVVFDNLDSNVSWYKMLKDHNLFWTLNTQVPFLGGINRDFLYSDLKLYSILYMLFPNLIAFIVGWYLRIAISMAGFVLLGNTIFNNKKNINVYLICGLLHGIIPIFPTCALEFASLPLLMYALIRLYRRWDWGNLIALVAYPIISDFSAFGIFICGYIVIFFFIDWIIKKKPAMRLLAGMLFLLLGYIVTEWRLFSVMLFSNEESIRSTFSTGYVGWKSAFDTFFTTIVFGESAHAGSSHTIIVFPVCIAFFIWINYGYIRSGNRSGIIKDTFNGIIVWQIFNYILYAIDRMEWFDKLMSTLMPPLKGFAFGRTVWFAPFVWYFAFMIALCRISWSGIVRALICCSAFWAICIYPSTYNHILWNGISVINRITGMDQAIRISGYESDILSYREFYSVKLFDVIKKDIGYDGEWSVAFGMHPAVLNYNGIATLDGYLSYYPKEYKDQFRKLIKPDFEVDAGHEDYFESYGGRAYIFSEEVSYAPYRDSDVTEADMLIDPDVFHEMGGKFVFSRVSIKNADELGLEKLGVYEDDGSPYTIYVYCAR